MTALLSLVEPPAPTVDDEVQAPGAALAEPDPAAPESYPPDPVEDLFDQWFRLVTAPFAMFAPVPVGAARQAVRRITHVDELM